MSDLADLSFVDEDEVDGRYRVLLYGQAKAGKSVGAATAPGPIMVLSLTGPARTGSPVPAMRAAMSARSVSRANKPRPRYTHLRRNPGDFQTVVVDPVGNVYDVLLKELGGGKPQIQHHGMVQTTILDFVKALRALPIHVVLVAHEEMSGTGDDDVAAVRRPMTGGQKLRTRSWRRWTSSPMSAVSPRPKRPRTGGWGCSWRTAAGSRVTRPAPSGGCGTWISRVVPACDRVPIPGRRGSPVGAGGPDNSDPDPQPYGDGEGPLSDEELEQQEKLV